MFITVLCPECKDETEHEVLSESRDRLVRCTACGHHHRIPLEKEQQPLVVKTVISHEGNSVTGTIEFDPDDECFIDDHLVAEAGDDAYGVEVTSIECGGKRPPRAKVKDITTIWTRTIDKVVVKISVHDGRKTIPLYLECEGEDEFVVGEKYVVDGKRFALSHLKLRDGPLMRKEGWKTFAYRIKRIYGFRS
ncbi:MAG: HVO_0476 family zinc finger protein [Methanoregula sp.]